MLYDQVLKGKNLQELTELFFSSDPDFGMTNDVKCCIYFDEVIRRMIQLDPNSIEFILNNYHKANAPRLRGMISAITCLEKYNEKLQSWVYQFLNHRNPFIVSEAIDTCTYFKDLSIKNHIEKLTNNKSEFVIGACIRYLAKLSPYQATPYLLKQLKSTSYIIKQNAIDGFDDHILYSLDEKTGKEIMREIALLSNDAHPDVRQAANTAINNHNHLVAVNPK